MALIERTTGFTVGTLESGRLTLGGWVEGPVWNEGLRQLQDLATQGTVSLLIEADGVSEDEANELLGFLRG
ncbi:MAG TPA: hypothetical protein VGN46_08950 [Luteibacter sp.]|uniref:hypothetical protein n=1 Tax=Luteibacter sp. TaxID=1886636 RepID=UPI002F42ED73